MIRTIPFNIVAHNVINIPVTILASMVDKDFTSLEHMGIPRIYHKLVINKNNTKDWNGWDFTLNDVAIIKECIENLSIPGKEYIKKYRETTGMSIKGRKKATWENHERTKLKEYLGRDIKVTFKMVSFNIKTGTCRVTNIKNYIGLEFLTAHAHFVLHYSNFNLVNDNVHRYFKALVHVHEYTKAKKDEYGIKTTEQDTNYGITNIRNLELMSSHEYWELKERYYKKKNNTYLQKYL